jgi:hypothetical protein
MANQQFLVLTAAGKVSEEISVATSVGAGSSGKIPALDTIGKLDKSMMPIGIGIDTIPAVATEEIAAGSLVNLYDVGGVLKMRNADATTDGKVAKGFVTALVASAATGTVLLSGNLNTSASGLTPGGDVFLAVGATGAVTQTAPTGAGNVVQKVGIALSADTFIFEPAEFPVTRYVAP